MCSPPRRLQPSAQDALAVVEFMESLDAVFGVLDPVAEDVDLDAEISNLIAERNQARQRRDFKRSDEIRDLLLERGIELIDTSSGTEWRLM